MIINTKEDLIRFLEPFSDEIKIVIRVNGIDVVNIKYETAIESCKDLNIERYEGIIVIS